MPRESSSPKKAAGKAVRIKSPAAREGRVPSVQQAFLDELVRAHTRVSIFLVNGVKLEGEIRSYDRYVILMKNAVTDKVYKHAVSTIMPMSGRPTAAETIIEKRTSRVRRGAVTTSGRG